MRSNYFINENQSEVNGLGNMCGLENCTLFTTQKDFVNLVHNNMYSGKLFCFVWLLMIKKNVVMRTSLFRSGIPYCEDTIFYTELMSVAKSIYFLNTATYHYYSNINSCTKSKEYYIRNMHSLARAYEEIMKITARDKFSTQKSLDILTNTYADKIMERLFYIYITEKKSQKEWMELFKNIFEDETIYTMVSKMDLSGKPTHLSIPFKLVIKKDFKRLYYFYKTRKMLRKIKGKDLILKVKIYLAYILCSIKYYFLPTKQYKILSDKETVDKVVNEKFSVSRFGDGEFKWILERKQTSFQNDNEKLNNRLKEVITNQKDIKLLIGIPISIKKSNSYVDKAKKFWRFFWVNEYKNIKKYLNQKEYANASFTRPYMDYKNKNENIMLKKFENIKRIWHKRDIVIVEGEKTMLGVGNDLFDNCNSIERIICPAKNAFEKYDEILEEAKKLKKDKLFLISLGPTATVLAYDLAREGYQAIDTGHIDIEYMWFKMGATTKEAIKGKYVNEAKNNDYLTEIKDEKYESEIIARVI